MFLEKLNQNKICVILVILISTIIGTIYSVKYTPKEYLSSSTIMLIKVEGENEKNAGGVELTKNLVSTFEEIAKSELTISEIKSNLNLEINNTELNDKINLERISKSDTFKIEVLDKDGRLALDVNTEVLNVFSNRIKDMYGDKVVYIVDAPHLSGMVYTKPISLMILLSFSMGILISVIYIIVLVQIEKNVKTVVDVEIEMFLKTLAQIPLKKYKKDEQNIKSELICYESEKSETSKAFKNFRTNLQFLSVSEPKQNKVLLITSAVKEEGKSYVAANMAVSFAEIGKKVLLLDADLVNGRLGKMFDVPNNLGLSNYLSGLDLNGMEINEFPSKFVRDTTIKNLNLITTGTIPPNSSELLTTSKLTDLIKDLKAFYDIIIVDGTPVLTSTDALILTRHVGGTIIVAGYKTTKKEDLLRAKRDIQNVGGRIVGVVLNKIKLKKKRKTKQERKEEFARFRVELKDKFKSIQNYIKQKMTNLNQKMLSEKNVIEIRKDIDEVQDIKEEISKKEIKKAKTEKTEKIEIKEQPEKEETNLNENSISKLTVKMKEKLANISFGDLLKNSKEKQEIVENVNQENLKVMEKIKIQEQQRNEQQIEEQKVEDKKSKEDKKEIVSKFYELKETAFIKAKTFGEKCVEKFTLPKNEIQENEIQTQVQKSPKQEKMKQDKPKQEKKEEFKDESLKNENTVLVIVDAENAYCRVFSKYHFTEKLIKGIDKTDGFPKDHYSSKILKRRLKGLMAIYNLTQEQAKRIDSLIFTTLSDYDESMWLDKKMTSNKAEQYALCMARDYEKNPEETQKEYIARCRRLRKQELAKAELDIEYKLDNLWTTNKMTFYDKIVLKRFAELYEIDNDMQNDLEKLKSKKNKKFYSDIIQAAERKMKRLNDADMKKTKLNEKVVQEDMELKQAELLVEQEKLEEERRLEQEKNRAEQEQLRLEKKQEQDRIREEKRLEKEAQKQEKREENIRKKQERQKYKEEQKLQKEMEKEKQKEEAKLEEELLVDNLYPKTKNNKNL